MALESKWVRVGDINTHYLVSGEGSPLILLHGASNDAQEWRFALDPLSQHHRTFAPDLVGFGQSDKPRASYSFPFFIDFVHNFMEELNLGRASLVGHSAGGGIALGFALRFPQMTERLILVDSTGLGRLSIMGKLLRPIYALSNVFRLGRRAASISTRWMRQPIDFQERLPEVEAPTLIVWGANDKTLPVSQAYAAQKAMKNAKLCVLPQCRHAPQQERPAEFNQLVLDFLSL
jgi:4,5:9,10-diseco-3-hydroxy-5,9,17-trioxoandrosta-1(10),2-diene-4-oate hydrolase